ncbi:MAG: HAMP domain-containing histidine kinase [Solobacterium sp.]|nr:HAMP domain-containing histidine kinase [Solobacterium sp.]MCH4222203.1 HAMP domain-containing histidine kinase [Solobacterium sp.]MCH4266208.1 HAMP domain-containing histidine kinase [Solobacterium sp.]
MKLDRHGIYFNIWMFFFVFAIGIVLMLGLLQFSLIRPYYRNNKIQNVRQVSDDIQTYIIESNGNETDILKAFQTTINNNLCVAIYNDSGNLIYDADSLGSGCVFHAGSGDINNASISYSDGISLVNTLKNNEGEWSQNITNSRTEQEMIVYGRTIRSNLGNYYLFVNSPLEPVDSIITFFSRQYFMYTIIVMIVASLISIKIAKLLTKPIVNMNIEAEKLAHADYAAHFDGGQFTETKELANTLNGATMKLSRIDELRKDLIANVSHDIKTPLTSIRAYAEMIRDVSGDNKEKREKHLNVIITEADYLDRLVVDMSELSKMQSGNYVLREKNFDLAQDIRDVVSFYEAPIEDGGLKVKVNVPDSLTVYADETKIDQVVSNFLSNAIKHTPAGRDITVHAWLKEDEETVRVEVRDQGEGISPQELPYIWDRYQKSSRSFSRSMSNTGLGLAIVKAILDTHHAEYGVESNLGTGSVFWFELKRPQEPEEIEHDQA